ncbi:endonuclease III domain-containing protein [Methanosalsum natronophilum]|uniref:thymine-DNA glycosylase n=1 Tax=Methanosalsum natronophilum TaxID=768733 RepID=A0A3R7XII6_9EURY|nr:endonuclease III [Methanosalsum natronophilum]MCS3923547.1 endonuclease-3 [Methanosalsum natronophilum]RQD87866.1 MAG: endonuclease III [Methanosalsum natronophilum]
MNFKQIILPLKKAYPKNSFYYKDEPFYVLISTVLSQRTRDEITYKSSLKLMSRFSSARSLSNASLEEIELLIKDVGFYRVKAQRIKQIAKIIENDYDGEVPDTLDELLKLPGVGSKTANCVLIYSFGVDTIAVDTHVHRISNRLGLVESETPEETESLLKATIPKKYWKDINELFVQLGQNVCRPMNPKCDICMIESTCPKVY